MEKFSNKLQMIKESNENLTFLCNEYEEKITPIREEYDEKFSKMILLILNKYHDYMANLNIPELGDFFSIELELGDNDPIYLSTYKQIVQINLLSPGEWEFQVEVGRNKHEEFSLEEFSVDEKSELLKGLVRVKGILRGLNVNAIEKINK